jgi:hypothetical protein
MEELVNHTWILFLDILENWPALIIVSSILTWVYHRFSKRQQTHFEEVQKHIKKIEFLQAIDHDYGMQIVAMLFDEYLSLGGNSYAHEKFEEYKKMKLEETK